MGRREDPVPQGHGSREFLANIPDKFPKVCTVGGRYSSGDIAISKQKKYQHTRIIAVFEFDQLKESTKITRLLNSGVPHPRPRKHESTDPYRRSGKCGLFMPGAL